MRQFFLTVDYLIWLYVKYNKTNEHIPIFHMYKFALKICLNILQIIFQVILKVNIFFSFTMELIWYEIHFMFLTSMKYAEAYLICPVFVQGVKWSIQNRQCSTFLSCRSSCFQLLAFNWWSSSNFILIFSMDNCSISQNPAKSWEAGLGCALGFCVREKNGKKHEKNQSPWKSQMEFCFLFLMMLATLLHQIHLE